MRQRAIGMRSHVLGALLGSLVFASGCGPAEQQEPRELDPASLPGKESKPDEELGTRRDSVVYGVDNRQDVNLHTDAYLRARAHQSTVALMRPTAINATNPDNVTFTGNTLQVDNNLCATERFLSDPSPAFCSGTLIDDDLVLTAGHCITAANCANTRFVFNFYRATPLALQTVTTQDIFSCSSVVARQLAVVNGQNLDFAVVRLDRSAVPRFTPAPVRSENAALPVGQGVAVIGSGSGIPYKIDSGGSVRDSRTATLDFFVANTDTFGGNSGSGVYDLLWQSVVGILVRGETDYVANGSCNIVNVCSETGCRGEDITYVRPALDAYCAVATSRRLCGETSLANALTYDRTNTSSASVNAATATLSLVEGQTVHIGTCGLPGAAYAGDTYLRLTNAASTLVAVSDDAFGTYCSNIKYTVPAGGGGNYQLSAGCYLNRSCRGTAVWSVSAGTYAAANTTSATINTVNRRFALTEGQVLNVGTCGVTGASFTGDTLLRLYDAAGAQVTASDDACGGTGSNIKYTVPVGKGGIYELRAGCYSSTACSGNLAWGTSGGSGSVVYTATNTASATTGTVNHDLILSAGQVLTVGTCGTPNAYTPSDTFLRLVNAGGTEVALSDDACGSGSRITYTAPADGIYQLRAGCYSANACSGTASYRTN
ncbi:trypsin-like peptidase domain-containing protein [Pyxidicoccus trucidator]|uniref:trypsin-like peptidase domain-containing protein n=1 Tax=Pyxidicoccus trucidator TaxID=2709662 RepID=UPI0013D9860D